MYFSNDLRGRGCIVKIAMEIACVALDSAGSALFQRIIQFKLIPCHSKLRLLDFQNKNREHTTDHTPSKPHLQTILPFVATPTKSCLHFWVAPRDVMHFSLLGASWIKNVRSLKGLNKI